MLPPQPVSPSPVPPPQPLDCAHWRYGAADEPAPGVLPAEYDRNNYKRTSLRDPRPELANSPQNQCGQKGSAVDLAWGVTKGRDDVLVSVLDSGIMWRRADRMADLATAAYINIGEARPPCAAAHVATATATASSTSATSVPSPTATATVSPIPRI